MAEGNRIGSLGCGKGLDAAGSQFEVSLKTGRYSYIPSEKRIHCSSLSVLELACVSYFVYW